MNVFDQAQDELAGAAYRIQVRDDIAYASDLDGALLAAATLVEDQQADAELVRGTITIFVHGTTSPFTTRLARLGCRSLAEWESLQRRRPRPDFDPRVDYPERFTDGPI